MTISWQPFSWNQVHIYIHLWRKGKKDEKWVRWWHEKPHLHHKSIRITSSGSCNLTPNTEMFDVVLAYVPLNQAKVFCSSRAVGAQLLRSMYHMEHTKLRGNGAQGLHLNMDRQLVPWAKTAENSYGIQFHFLRLWNCGASLVRTLKGFLWVY